MKTKTRLILSIMHVLSWIIFIGLSIKTGTIIISGFVSLAVNPVAAENLHLGLNLSKLYDFSREHYIVVVTLLVFLSALKAYLFYQVIKIFLKINLVHPFSEEVYALISKIGNVTISIAVITLAANTYCDWLTKKGVVFPDLQEYLGGAGEFLLTGGIIFIIALVFKRGIEIQSENELTV